jgi:Leucine-rich repeat (LRR) protein
VGLASLVQLNASRNYITDIHEEAFLKQTKLETVDLSSNSLTHIEPKTFIRNPSLQTLSLSNNQNFRLSEDSFLSSTSLTVLHLSACNLSHIPPKTFQELPNLRQLYISHNQIITLHPLQGVQHLTTLDVSDNYLRDLQSDVFVALPKLNHLNLSFNNFSILTVSVITQLANVRNVDLLGNPWGCDCLMYRKMYSWCRNNSVDLNLVCSRPSRFEGKLWTIYEEKGCDDDNHHHTDVEYKVENVTMININLPSNGSHANYSILPPSGPAPTQIQKGNMNHSSVYFYFSIGLAVLLLSLLTIAILLYKCHFASRQSKRTGPAQADFEQCPLSAVNR